MNDNELRDRLTEAARLEAAHLTVALYGIIDELERSGAGMSAVRTILKFMEENPSVDFGAPGPLVQFVESIGGYEAELYASLARHPVGHTVWMLNRILNVTYNVGDREKLIMLLEAAGKHARADGAVKQRVKIYMEHQGR